VRNISDLQVLSRFARMEYSLAGGDTERGRTMFERILHTYPKRNDIWALYIDLVLKHGGVLEAR